MKPYKKLPRSVRYNGRKYRLDLSYSTFYRVVDLMADTGLLDGIKLTTALDMLVKGRHPNDPGLLTAIYDLLLEDKPQGGNGEKVMDIAQDWGYICAAFQQAYGIDLYKNKRMHILQFMALLRGIPQGTKLADIIHIRTVDIPAPTKGNAQYIANLQRAKAQFALRSDVPMDDQWGGLFELLKQRATNG